MSAKSSDNSKTSGHNCIRTKGCSYPKSAQEVAARSAQERVADNQTSLAEFRLDFNTTGLKWMLNIATLTK